MFTQLNNILNAKPRHAEHNDTRQDIQRHDPEFERRRRKKEKSDEDLYNEEGTTIAIDAIILFLNKFLKELTDKPKQGFNALSASHPPEASTTIKTQKQEPSGAAANAANAYQQRAQNQQRTSILEDINDHNAEILTLNASEVRTIHALLEDLKLLTDKNIAYLHVEKSTSFLQSLVNAVETVKKSSIFKR